MYLYADFVYCTERSSCKSREEIDEFVSWQYGMVYARDYSFNAENYANPWTPYWRNTGDLMIQGFGKFMEVYV